MLLVPHTYVLICGVNTYTKNTTSSKARPTARRSSWWFVCRAKR